jgi:hypothetical protein
MTRTLQDYNPVGCTNPELQTKVGIENFETQDKVVACVLHDGCSSGTVGDRTR